MDSTQLPPPTLPSDSPSTGGGLPPQSVTTSNAVEETGGTNASVADTPTNTTPPPSTPAGSPPAPTPTAFGGTSASNPPATPAQTEEPVFRSPIIEGLQQMQTEPFQAPVVPAESSGKADLPDNSPAPLESSLPVESESSSTLPPTETATSGNSGQPPAKTAKIEGSIFGKKWFLGLVGTVVILVIGFLGWNFWQGRSSGTPSDSPNPVSAKITLTYWGLWEDEAIVQPLIKKYEALNPGITIKYERQNHRQYRSRLQAAIRQGQGPDIFRFHNTWMPMIQDDLNSAPSGAISAQEIKDEFYPVVAQDVVRGNQVYGVPLMYEGLALVYNESMLQAANALPPRDWKSLREIAAALTIRSEARLERGGVAMGTAENVDHYSDILGLLMLQNGAKLADPTSETTRTVLEFYTLFHRIDGDWDMTMPQSTLAFANEQVAMIFVPSWRIHEIRTLNPNLKFGVAQVPQLSDEKITWASYWLEGVSKKSSHSQEAWEFITWLSQPEQLRELAAEATKYRGFGELYPRVEMASELSEDPDLMPYLQDALYAQSYPLADRTHDEGLNDQLITYFKDAINVMNKDGRSTSALESIAPGVKSVLSKFGVAAGR